MRVFASFFSLFFILTSELSAELTVQKDFLDPPTNFNILSFRRNQGETLATKKSYTTLESFVFPIQYKILCPFIDFRIHCFDNLNYAANVGLGIRNIPTFNHPIFGFNVFYDSRKIYHRTHFHQLGLGFEILGNRWNFRLNGYLPVGKKTILKSFYFFNDYIGDYFFLKENFRDCLKGFDSEIESLFKRNDWFEAYFAVGGYYYRSNGCHKNIYGSKYRFSTNFAKYFSFNVLVSYDSIFKTRCQSQLSINFPFYFQSENYQRNTLTYENTLLYKAVIRQELIVLENRSRWYWNF